MIKLYFKYQELKQPTLYVANIDNFDHEEDILICIYFENEERQEKKVVFREPLDEIKISDVRFINSRDRSEANQKDSLIPNFDVDNDH